MVCFEIVKTRRLFAFSVNSYFSSRKSASRT